MKPASNGDDKMIKTKYAIKVGGNSGFTFIKRVDNENEVQLFRTQSEAKLVAGWYREKGWTTKVVGWAQ